MSKDNWTGNWPVERALNCIDRDMGRMVPDSLRSGDIGKPYWYDVCEETDDSRRAYLIGLRNGYLMSKQYINSINEIKPPDPPTLYNDLMRLTRKLRNNFGDLISTAVYSAESAIMDVAEFIKAPNEYEED